MKDGLRFVDSDMHIMEPPDLFERYLDPKFKHRVRVPIGGDGKPKRATSAQIVIDGLAGTGDADMQQHRKRTRAGATQSTQPLSGSRLADTGRLDFAIQRGYNPEAQVMGMEIEGVDIAVLYPTNGLSLLARNDMDPELSLAICQAYNNWISEFCRYSPDRLKFVAMMPMHDVHIACRELVRGVRELGAVGSFIRPNMVNGRYWHSNYWDPLYTVHEDLNVTWGFHEGTGAHYSYHNILYGENRWRTCWAVGEGIERGLEATAGLIGPDRMCISTDYPPFDSNFPHVAENLLKNVDREIAAQIFMGGAHLYGFNDTHFAKADAA